MTQKLQDIFSPDGFTIGINHGKVSGQAVDHLHIHIIPRFKGDGGKSIHSVVDNSPESLAEIKEKFK
jgi:histidine triad (HIT) family protein